jgi:hypothetical protein
MRVLLRPAVSPTTAATFTAILRPRVRDTCRRFAHRPWSLLYNTRQHHSSLHSSFPASMLSRLGTPQPPKSKIAVFGAGNFGSCLADHLGDSDHDVFLWSRDEEQGMRGSLTLPTSTYPASRQ